MVMGGVCRDNDGQCFVWRSHFSATTRDHLVNFGNPGVDVTINNLELIALISQLQLFTPIVPPLTHVCTYVDNTTSQG